LECVDKLLAVNPGTNFMKTYATVSEFFHAFRQFSYWKVAENGV
jgi:hypothetical protein